MAQNCFYFGGKILIIPISYKLFAHRSFFILSAPFLLILAKLSFLNLRLLLRLLLGFFDRLSGCLLWRTTHVVLEGWKAFPLLHILIFLSSILSLIVIVTDKTVFILHFLNVLRSLLSFASPSWREGIWIVFLVQVPLIFIIDNADLRHEIVLFTLEQSLHIKFNLVFWIDVLVFEIFQVIRLWLMRV